ncbi:MAG: MGMT family protein [Candidatus Verstraetearchaeota archaeon]|jgi:O-6-methylguanine DNA methyltransferase|nr:MGMT family protein [Candidatus Verstraetearchaeota archaeon]
MVKTKLGWIGFIYNEKLVRNSIPFENPKDVKEFFRKIFKKELIEKPNEVLENEIINAIEGKSFNINFNFTSDFQKKVLSIIMKIPKGKVTTYKSIAIAIGNEKLSRAIGNILFRNPFPIIIPCHRVIRSDRKIGGYSYGEELKEKILRLEGIEIENKKVKEKYLLPLNMLFYHF